MTADDASVAMIGMPATGKSTFLAALYQGLTDPPPAATARLASQPAQRAYLEELRQAWLNGQAVGRTRPDSGELIELDLLYGTHRVALTVPDIAGEAFRNIFIKRQADAHVAALVREAGGLMLFTHPDHQRPRVSIAEVNEMHQMLGEEHLPGQVKEFDSAEVPGEVQLVDLLQWALDVRSQRQDATPCRVVVIVSAWDRAGNRTPEEWVIAKMPMLRQFLDAESGRLESKIYGVSAQGGDYAAEALAERRPSERPRVVSVAGTDSDLAEPLRWAALG